MALLTAPVLLTLWFGQQATLLLLLFAGALLALRRGRAGLAGLLLAGMWVKPHLFVPLALLVPLLLDGAAPRVRYLAGFTIGTALGTALTLITTGPGSMLAWISNLVHYSNNVEAVQNNIPSVGGMALVLLPHPWNRLVAIALTAVTFIALAVVAVRLRKGGVKPWDALPVLMAGWILVVPYVHTPDQVLLLPALAVAWGKLGVGRHVIEARELIGMGAWVLPVLALWVYTALPLLYTAAPPWRYLDVLPPALILLAASNALWKREQNGHITDLAGSAREVTIHR